MHPLRFDFDRLGSCIPGVILGHIGGNSVYHNASNDYGVRAFIEVAFNFL